MEANLFQEINDALEKHKNLLVIPLQNGCPIQKIVWSSFNYMVGPELKFVWEPLYEEPSHIGTSDETSSDGNYPSTSSEAKSTQSGLQFDEYLNIMTESGEFGYLNEDSGSTTKQSTQSNDSQAGTSTLCSSSVSHNVTQNIYNQESDDNSSYTRVNDTDNEDSDEKIDSQLITSIVDSGITGTVSVHSDLSRSCRSPNLNVQYEEDERLSVASSEKSDYGYCDDKAETKEEQSISDDNETIVHCLNSQVTAGFLTVSNMMTEMSVTGDQLTDPVDKSSLLQQESETLKQLEDERIFTDEMFVARFSLAEQLTTHSFETNPVVSKVAIVPSRQLLVYSFLFCVPNDHKEMMALSLLMSDEARDWLSSREKCFQEIFDDIIPRFKASYLTEAPVDMICRITENFMEILSVFGYLERHCLVGLQPNIKSTLLMKPVLSKEDRSFLYKAITGCLMCQGNCVVVGADPLYVEQFMLTLAQFLPREYQQLSLKPHLFNYSPYLKLQAVQRHAIEDLYLIAAESHWPTCFIDIDRGFVTYSGSYSIHSERKEALSLFQLGSIYRETGTHLTGNDKNISKKEPIIDPVSVEMDSWLSSQLDAFWLLPSKRSVRLSSLNQLMLCMEYRAKALFKSIKEMSEPSTDKGSAVSSKWSLTAVRKMLNFQNDFTYAVVLASADILKPDLARFIHECSAHF